MLQIDIPPPSYFIIKIPKDEYFVGKITYLSHLVAIENIKKKSTEWLHIFVVIKNTKT